ncbi:hypothetical protein GCM10023215_01430 [Pseudonocardia yuanmonensis]|uniref:Uncharacterized protein n=1 Tax=Pseudonocardia yuanmonensis TaxID=1095914 RepID=A0ABP8VWA3_9PSEU
MRASTSTSSGPSAFIGPPESDAPYPSGSIRPFLLEEAKGQHAFTPRFPLPFCRWGRGRGGPAPT